MRELKVTLETVTPLFLGGADPRGAPELRPPSVRGALRYWLRAALGGVIGDRNLDGLHRLESAVFGSTDYGSIIQVRLKGGLKCADTPILPHKSTVKGQRNAFIAGQPIDLILSQYRDADETVWQAACSTLALALTFGGVGLRSRRGYGTFRIVQSSDSELVPPTPDSLDEWPKHIQQIVRSAVTAMSALARAYGVPTPDLRNDPARYPCATRVGLIRITDLQASSALDAVRQFMYKVPQNQALGGIRPRQASPLWVRPIVTAPGRYGLLLIVLASQLKQGTDYDFVRRFLDRDFPVAGQDIQVKGWNT